jgi:hypothetical protein
LFLPSTTQKFKFTSSTDMFFSSVPIPQTSIQTPMSSNTDRNLKRYLRSKAWRDRQRKIIHALPASRPSRTSSSTFINSVLEKCSIDSKVFIFFKVNKLFSDPVKKILLFTSFFIVKIYLKYIFYIKY